jgi:hypothetical protein
MLGLLPVPLSETGGLERTINLQGSQESVEYVWVFRINCCGRLSTHQHECWVLCSRVRQMINKTLADINVFIYHPTTVWADSGITYVEVVLYSNKRDMIEGAFCLGSTSVPDFPSLSSLLLIALDLIGYVLGVLFGFVFLACHEEIAQIEQATGATIALRPDIPVVCRNDSWRGFPHSIMGTAVDSEYNFSH